MLTGRGPGQIAGEKVDVFLHPVNTGFITKTTFVFPFKFTYYVQKSLRLLEVLKDIATSSKQRIGNCMFLLVIRKY